jgi:hypothetical protein
MNISVNHIFCFNFCKIHPVVVCHVKIDIRVFVSHNKFRSFSQSMLYISVVRTTLSFKYIILKLKK